MKEYISSSPDNTAEIAKDIIKYAEPGMIFALYGGMGAGKTCLTSGIASALGFDGEVSSPTFAVVNEYCGGRLPIAHFDMYRVEGWDDLYSTGFFDYIDNGYLLVVEWSENIEGALEGKCVKITLEHIDETTRKITVCEEC